MVHAAQHPNRPPSVGERPRHVAVPALGLTALVVFLAALAASWALWQAPAPGYSAGWGARFAHAGDRQAIESLYFGTGPWTRSRLHGGTCSTGGLECLLDEPLHRSAAPPVDVVLS